MTTATSAPPWWVQSRTHLAIAAALAVVLVASVAGLATSQPGAATPQPVTQVPATGTGQTEQPTAPPTTVATDPAGQTPSQLLTGDGPAEADVTARGGVITARSSHSGESNFIVTLFDSAGNIVGTLANAVGEYSGAAGVSVAPGAYTVVVDAEGPWEVLIEQPLYGPDAPPPTEFEGEGDDLTEAFTLNAPATVTAEHSGEGSFSIDVLTTDGATPPMRLVEGDGAVEEQAQLDVPPGVYVLSVRADGGWRVAFQ